jgi:hypothetical protein
MWKFAILVCVSSLPTLVWAQDPEKIISDLRSIDSGIASAPCQTGEGALISNRAMNLFLADRIGYYLSQYHDVSFNKNYITFQSIDGSFSLNHNFFHPKDGDEQVRAFTVGGIKANVLNPLETGFKGEEFPGGIGLALTRTWISNVKTHFAGCDVRSPAAGQKQNMDMLRAGILHSLEVEFANKQADFEKVLDSIKPADVPGQDINGVKAVLRQKFFQDMLDYLSWESARRQSDELIKTGNYDLVTTSWTSLYGYIPLLPQKYLVAGSLSSDFEAAYGYPVALAVSHTRFFEGRKTGRVLLTVSAGAYMNNEVQSLTLAKTTPSEYPSIGGTDSLDPHERSAKELYIGAYKNFVTPVINLQVVYFPPTSHIGFSVASEQNIGHYNPLNLVFGMPIVLIDRAGHPAANFQFQCRLFDISNKILPGESVFDKTTVGLSVAVPFSKIIY